MTYVYEDELDDYLAMGYPVDQLHILKYGAEKPEQSEFSQEIWERTMKLKEIRKIVKSVIRESVTFDNNKTFIPPPNVVQRAQEALNATSSNNLTQSGTDIGSGLSKGKELASKQTQSFDMMRKMKSFFDTQEDAYKAEKAAGKTIKDSGLIQSWELRGGDSSKEWINQELSSLHKDNLNTKSNLRKAGGAGVNKGMGIFDSNIMKTNNHRIHR